MKAKDAQKRGQVSPDLTFSFYSVGRKQVDGVRAFLEKYCNFDMRQVVIIDAARFPHPRKGDPSEGHIGTHEAIWNRVATARDSNGNDLLLKVCREIYQQTKALEPDVHHVKVVFVCNWGKHRSVALAEMLTHALQPTSACNELANHLNWSVWSRHKCGRRECFCYKMTADKVWCSDFAFSTWCRAFHER